MAKKAQVPVVGGLRKVIAVGQNNATTIVGLEGQQITLAQLQKLLATPAASGSGSGTSTKNPGSSLAVGPGLQGGGAMIGNVPLYLAAPIPAMGADEPDEPMVIPGPPGAQGAPGLTGIPGPRGEDADDEGTRILMLAPPVAPSYVSFVAAAGSANNIAPAGFSWATRQVDVDTTAGAATFTGLGVAGADGQEIIVTPTAANNLTLSANSAASTYPFRLPADLTLTQYDAQRFRFVASIGKWCMA